MIRILLVMVLTAAVARAQLSPQEAAQSWLAGEPLRVLPSPATLEAALAWRDELVAELSRERGPPVGRKAALTNPDVRRRFRADEPIAGLLLSGMIRDETRAWPARFGVRPHIEADLLVRVADEAIRRAETDEDLLACLDVVCPFIEVPDLPWPPEAKPSALDLFALNAGAWAGSRGRDIALRDLPDAMERLAAFRVRLRDESGTVLAEGAGASLMEHPIRVVRWLRDEAEREGSPLRAGEWLSLGSLTPLIPLRPGSTYSATYEGLDSGGDATVHFRSRARAE